MAEEKKTSTKTTPKKKVVVVKKKKTQPAKKEIGFKDELTPFYRWVKLIFNLELFYNTYKRNKAKYKEYKRNAIRYILLSIVINVFTIIGPIALILNIRSNGYLTKIDVCLISMMIIIIILSAITNTYIRNGITGGDILTPLFKNKEYQYYKVWANMEKSIFYNFDNFISNTIAYLFINQLYNKELKDFNVSNFYYETMGASHNNEIDKYLEKHKDETPNFTIMYSNLCIRPSITYINTIINNSRFISVTTKEIIRRNLEANYSDYQNYIGISEDVLLNISSAELAEFYAWTPEDTKFFMELSKNQNLEIVGTKSDYIPKIPEIFNSNNIHMFTATNFMSELSNRVPDLEERLKALADESDVSPFKGVYEAFCFIKNYKLKK